MERLSGQKTFTINMYSTFAIRFYFNLFDRISFNQSAFVNRARQKPPD
jgi:hypothetical protein